MLKKLAIIGFGSTMIAIGINAFIQPLYLINGGFLGISLLLKYLWGFKVGITFILLSIPVCMLALKSDPVYFINGVIGVICSGLMIEIFKPLNGMVHLPILS